MQPTRSLAVIAMMTIALVACGKDEPPATVPTPTQPTQPTTTRDTAAENAARRAQAQRDSAERANAAAAATRETSARLRSTLEEMVFFDYDQSSIRGDARAVLDRKVPILRANPNVTIRIEGHADERGSVEYNLALSLRRANSIRDYLMNFGIESSRFEVVPMGEERPLEQGETEEAFQQNRRGEFHITRGGDNLMPPR